MKHFSVLIIGLSLLLYYNTSLGNDSTDNQTGVQTINSSEKTLNILSSPELYSLTTNWADEYGRLNPTMKIVLSNIPENQAIAYSDLSFISDENSAVINNEKSWKMVVGREAIVPVINAKNPMLNEIYSQGISAEEFAQLFNNPEKINWAALIDGGKNESIQYYIIDTETVKANLANFTKTNYATINGIKVATATELISAIQKDIYAIGFCKLVDVRDSATNDLIENIKLLPIDRNQNGRIDNFENIYDNMNAFTRGVWIGKYPHDLYGNIYAVSSTKPTDKNELAFLTWVLADGQQFLNRNGYSNLVSSEINSNRIALSEADTTVNQPNKSSSSMVWILSILAIIIAAGITFAAVRTIRHNRSNEMDEEFIFTPAFDENSLLAPKGLYFDKTHTWAFMEKDGMVKIGIDDFLQHITGTLTRIKMKAPGEKVRRGEKILTIIRNGKQLTIYAPISGTIKEQNQKLITDSSIMNMSPYSDGWVYLIEPKNWLREIQFLFMGENYKEWLQDEFARLKDFFTTSVKSNTAVYAHLILQDGGELTDNVLAELEPEVWEDFQTKFIDTSK